MAMLIFFTCLVVSVGMVGADVHHIVRGETGWELSYNHPALKPSEAIFKVGDHIWFRNASTQDSIVEVRSRKEYISCDVSNPIKMYTDGSDKISLQEEGMRYFASGNPRGCKNGLKLHVEVRPLEKHDETQTVGSTTTTSNGSAMIKATGPTPSTSTHLSGLSCLVFIELLVVLVGLI